MKGTNIVVAKNLDTLRTMFITDIRNTANRLYNKKPLRKDDENSDSYKIEGKSYFDDALFQYLAETIVKHIDNKNEERNVSKYISDLPELNGFDMNRTRKLELYLNNAEFRLIGTSVANNLVENQSKWYNKSRTEYINEARMFYHLAKTQLEERFHHTPELENHIGDMYRYLSSFEGMYKVVNIFDNMFGLNDEKLDYERLLRINIEEISNEHFGKTAGLIKLVA
ncbi:MAG: hypothetical protein WC755_00010 [Candidatus Woesearchaeota archaeon]|jgi:hypothetical protein